ncbi:S-layer homology domain-containing protein [Cohnella sp. AR92]|uniref:S-layer homology domain-containing protein n=1 Tax=Cohnella sp. AR92 TaxID=648716 RepID=UPI000F8F3D20|nr:S-layer homology domain-containing protein [Cohnella sp. AR92]RUS48398.1 glycoside hydrolase [Cohnella sp. AR92]
MRFARTRRILLPILAAFSIGAGSLPLAPSAANAASSLPFDDISSSYARDDITALAAKGIVGGTSERLFEPGKTVTRAEFAAILVRAFGLEETNNAIAAFQDVKSSQWFYGAVQAASNLELVSGTSATAYQPLVTITREQAAVILARALKLNGASSSASGFVDFPSISSWAQSSVGAAVKAGLFKGDENGAFRPTSKLTRAEIAVLFHRIVLNKAWESQFAATSGSMLQIGWQYGQTLAEYKASIGKSAVNTLAPRVFFLDSAGSITDNTDSALLTWAASKGKKVWGMFGNRFNAETTHAMLSSTANRQQVVAQTAALADKYGIDGVNLDFENVIAGDRYYMTLFVQELATALHKAKMVLSVNVSPDLGTDWTDAFDYEAIGEAADHVVLMAYDEHWGGSPIAGSVSSLPWMKSGLDTLLESIPSSKTIMALPFFTRDWTTGSAVSSTEMTIAEQNALIGSLAAADKSWNAALGQYVYAYKKGQTTHRIWTEESRSLTAKIRESLQSGATGFAYWYIGGESPDVWPSVRNAVKYESFRFE